jgi:diaminopimelate epimerase
VHLTKHHGLGNDFLIVLDEGSRPPDADLARRLCDRRTGVGADGLIWARPPTPEDGDVDVVFRLWNSDGSEAEVSGNGLRCVAHAIARARSLDRASIAIATAAGVRRADVHPTGDPRTADVEVDMGPVTPLPATDLDAVGIDGPEDAHRHDLVAGTVRGEKVAVGNPHLVLQASDPFDVDLPAWGPFYERGHDGGINVEFIRLADADVLDMVVWERGSGVTQACGSGATAAAHVAHGWGLVGEQVEVRMPGGSATVTLTPDGARLRGPSTFVADLEVPDV